MFYIFMSSYISLIYSIGLRRTYARSPIVNRTNATKLNSRTIVPIAVYPRCAKT